LAHVFVVFARTGSGISVFFLQRETDGLAIEPLDAVIGLRGSMLGHLRLHDCFVPDENLIGSTGRGHPQISTAALTLGRLGVAAGCVGLLQACADAGFQYSRTRHRGGIPIANHQLIAARLTDIYMDLDAARLLCMQSAILMEENDPRSVVEVAIAKHFSATAAMRAAHSAVQIHGASGCSSRFSVERYFRDAKVMEIIEGTSELQQLIIGEYGYAEIASFIRSEPTVSKGKPNGRE
jgi:alkylation response protein AidB-like acyl-CoA dehydrogenase